MSTAFESISNFEPLVAYHEEVLRYFLGSSNFLIIKSVHPKEIRRRRMGLLLLDG